MTHAGKWVARWASALALTLALSLPGTALAVQPDEVLPDPRLEARARVISADLRCLVCQNQSIDDSNAPLARDLRLLVRERLNAGDSDKAVLDFVVQRYGDFVLLRPPVNTATLVLWLAPLLLLIGACALAARHVLIGARSDTAGVDDTPLSAEESRRLEKLLKQKG